MLSVELVDENKEAHLLRIWFPKIACCHYLTNDSMEYFMEKVERTNNHTKISELFDRVEEFYGQMLTEYGSKKRFLGLNIKSSYKILRYVTSIIAVVNTLMIFFSFVIDEQTGHAH